jgi:hypothetical protein
MTFKNAFAFCCILIAAQAFQSCKKNGSSFGKDAYDPDLLLDANGVDTFSIVANSMLIDTTFSRNARFALIGAYNDPVTGTAVAQFNTQVRLSASNPDFGDLAAIEVDSVVLALEYRDQYGTGNVPQTFVVYELGEALSSDTDYTYESATSVIVDNLMLPGFESLTPELNERPVISGDTLNPQLRLRLKPSFGLELIQSSEQGHMASNDAFLEYFKGIQVRTEQVVVAENSGAIYSLDLIDSDSKMVIYYKQGGELKTFDLVINNNSVYYNAVAFDRGASPLQNLLDNSALANDAFYAQTGHVRAVLKFPTVQNLSSKTIVHRATLYLPYSYFNGDERYPSPGLAVTNNRKDTEDPIWGLSVSNGTLIPTFHPIVPAFKRYTIDVTSFIQGLINQNPTFTNPELFITSYRTNDNVERIVFNGVDSQFKYQPKLIITYTEF